MMKDIIVIMILGAILGFVTSYIVKEKRKGTKCIGCPSASTCGKKTCDHQ